jgi:hypothetical protein
MPKIEIKIERDQNLFIIRKDKNFDHLISLSIVFYERIMSFMQKTEGVSLQMNPKFVSLLQKITTNSEKLYLSQEDITIFVDWVDCLCLIMLDIDSIDYANKDIKKYLTLSERFIKKSKELMAV